MPADKLAAILRRLGLAYVVTLLLQLRIDGRPVLAWIQALAFLALLRPLRELVSSPEAQRAWRAASASAVVGVVVGIAALIPAVEPGTASLAEAIVLVFGTISYATLLSHWAQRDGRTESAAAFDRARRWLTATLVWIGVGASLQLALVERVAPGTDVDPTEVLFGRSTHTSGALVVLAVLAAVWIPALVLLQRANREVRRGLVEAGPSAEVAPA